MPQGISRELGRPDSKIASQSGHWLGWAVGLPSKFPCGGYGGATHTPARSTVLSMRSKRRELLIGPWKMVSQWRLAYRRGSVWWGE